MLKHYHRLGYVGEWLCIGYLYAQRYFLIQKNYRCKYGEIDAILHNAHGICVFLEVKTTLSASCKPILRICSRKQQRIIRTSKYFLHCNQRYHQYDIRYDVILLDLSTLRFTWYQNAFQDVPELF